LLRKQEEYRALTVHCPPGETVEAALQGKQLQPLLRR